MHCPNCGKQNAEQAKYCRACGNDLEIVSQAVKGRLPILIASKVDQLLDSRSERFRRDSLVSAVISLTVLSGGLVSWLNGYAGVFSEPSSFIVVTLFCALLSLLEYTAYRRSLSPDFDWTILDQKGGFTSPSVISLGLFSPKVPDEEAPSERSVSEMSRPSISESTTRDLSTGAPYSRERVQIIYCPGCGRANAQDADRCSVCGANLEVIARALEPRQQSWLTAMLDSYIRWRDRNLYKANQTFFLSLMMSCLWVLLAVEMITKRQTGWWYYLLLSFILLVTGAWDRVTFRRNSQGNEPRSPKPVSARSNVPIADAAKIDRFERLKLVTEPTERGLMERASITKSTTPRPQTDSSLRTDPLRKHAVASDED